MNVFRSALLNRSTNFADPKMLHTTSRVFYYFSSCEHTQNVFHTIWFWYSWFSGKLKKHPTSKLRLKYLE